MHCKADALQHEKNRGIHNIAS